MDYRFATNRGFSKGSSFNNTLCFTFYPFSLNPCLLNSNFPMFNYMKRIEPIYFFSGHNIVSWIIINYYHSNSSILCMNIDPRNSGTTHSL